MNPFFSRLQKPSPGPPPDNVLSIPTEHTMIITLKHPLKLATGETVSTLTLRRGKRKDMAAAAKYSSDAGEQEDFLFARLTGLTVEDIGELDLADAKQLADSFRDMVEERDAAVDASAPAGAAGRDVRIDGRDAAAAR
ncbi:phage tail assembly protein [Burkholderia thailandensis]|uniref:phage tail assembly protein n=1 Tax=Burkholderia thailandensis TaxID=57975 RepID=UPI0030C6A853